MRLSHLASTLRNHYRFCQAGKILFRFNINLAIIIQDYDVQLNPVGRVRQSHSAMSVRPKKRNEFCCTSYKEA